MTPRNRQPLSQAPGRDVVRRMLAERESILREAPPGNDAAGRLSATADEAIAELAERAAPLLGGRWSVVALGGYGAGRLLPRSDLDLLVLAEASPSAVRPFAQSLLYPLWDSGIRVGHQSRTPRDNLRAAFEDIATLTSLLTARPVAGDEDLAEECLAEVASRAHSAAAKVLQEIRRRDRPGSPYLLEPDLKEGAGGQRDIDELVWTAAVLTSTPTAGFGPLLRLGVIDEREAEMLREAADSITSARWMLDIEHPRAAPVLELHAAAGSGIDAESLQASLANVYHVLHRVRARATTARKRAHVRPAGEDMPSGWDPSRLFDALRRGPVALHELEDAAWSGELDALVPGIRQAMSLRRPGIGHRLTVGAHCLETAARVVNVVDGDVLGAEMLAALPDDRPLIVAALTHDFGKRESGAGHPMRGAEHAVRAASRLGLPPAAVTVAARLVREHLLLAETAFSQDISDERVLDRAAARVPDGQTLAALYLLTRADSIATGPSAWSRWHEALVGELVVALSGGLADAVRAEPQDAEVLAAEVLAAPPGSFRFLVSPGPVDATWRVTVATRDVPGTFARLAGVLALNGLDILSADARPAFDSVALDSFVVRSATMAPVEPSSWTAFERSLRATLEGRLALETRLAQRRRHYPATTRAMTPDVRVDVTTEGLTPVRVEAGDRVGLLHDLALAIAEEGLDIRSATIVTQDGFARDTFMVAGADGRPLRDPALVSALAARLRASASG